MSDIIGELVDLDMEPKQESMWGQALTKDEFYDNTTSGSRGKTWDPPFRVRCLGPLFLRDGRDFKAQNGRCA